MGASATAEPRQVDLRVAIWDRGEGDVASKVRKVLAREGFECLRVENETHEEDARRRAATEAVRRMAQAMDEDPDEEALDALVYAVERRSTWTTLGEEPDGSEQRAILSGNVPMAMELRRRADGKAEIRVTASDGSRPAVVLTHADQEAANEVAQRLLGDLE